MSTAHAIRWTLCVLVLAGLHGALAVRAQEPAPRVRAFVQPQSGITEASPIQLVIQIEGQGGRVLPPALTGLVNLRLVGGPSTNQQFRWVNGRSSAMTQLIYVLQPERVGPALVPALDVTIGNTTHRTESIELQIAKGAPGSAPAPLPQRREPQVTRDGADVFVHAEIGANEVWVGQSLPLSVALYTTASVSGASLTAQPSLDQFWVEDLEVDPNAEAHTEAVRGRRYNAYPIVRKVLVPQSSGTFTIDPWNIEMQARVATGDLFDVFGGRTQTIVRKSDPLQVRVRDLPATGQPAGFSGAVGNFSIRATLDRPEAEVDDAVALKAVVEGEGFLKLATAPELQLPPDVKVLEPKVTESHRVSGGRLTSRKTWEWVLVPLAAGRVELPELRFAYFDPAASAYRTASAAPGTLVVRRGAGAPDTARTPGGIQMRRRDIAFIKPLRGPLLASTPRAFDTLLFRVLLALPALWLPALILLGRRRVRLQSDQGLARSRRARARARRTLAAARRRARALDAASFYQEVGRALVEYVADRFNRSPAGLSYEVADDLLAARGVQPDLRRRFRSCLETCDFARFVPAANQAERRTELLEEASQIVEDLERAL